MLENTVQPEPTFQAEPSPSPAEAASAAPPRTRRGRGWACALIVGLLLLCCACAALVGLLGLGAMSGGAPALGTVLAGLPGMPTPTFTPSPTPTCTPTPTPTATPTPRPTATRTPTPIPGIGAPVTIQGIQLQLTDARLQDSYTHFQTFSASKPGDTLLVVKGRVLVGDLKAVPDWDVYTIDETGRRDTSGVKISGTIDGQPNTIIWLIAVAKTSRSFTMHFPGGTKINLAPLLGGGARAAATTVPSPATIPGGAGPLPPAAPFVCQNPHTVDFSSVLQFGRFDDQWARASVKGGEYYIAMKQADSWAWATDSFLVTDGVFEVDAWQTVAGPGDYGLAFAVDDPDNAKQIYAFAIESDGYYVLSKYTEGGGWVDLKTRSRTPFLYTDGKPNRLKAVRQGSLIALYANDIPLATVYYPTIADGHYAGLMARSGREAAGLEARFDNYTVCPLTEPYPMPLDPLARKAQRWPAGQPVLLTWTWPAATSSDAQAFADLADTTLIVDGEEYHGLREYWGAPIPCVQGYAVQWSLPLSDLPVGKHRLEIRVSLPQAVTDGRDQNRDGQPDTYGPGEVFHNTMELSVE